jgi:hypothetical protein
MLGFQCVVSHLKVNDLTNNSEFFRLKIWQIKFYLGVKIHIPRV